MLQFGQSGGSSKSPFTHSLTHSLVRYNPYKRFLACSSKLDFSDLLGQKLQCQRKAARLFRRRDQYNPTRCKCFNPAIILNLWANAPLNKSNLM